MNARQSPHFSARAVARSLWLCLFLPLGVSAQTTAFTYQGNLRNNNVAATGVYDLTFSLFTASTAGSQTGDPVTNAAVGVTNGLFSVALDFGTNFTGADRWLEIAVRTNGPGPFFTLSPRQQITSTPYSITARNVSGPLPAAQVVGIFPSTQLGSLTNHTDVSAASLTAGNVLAFSGTIWTNGPVVFPGNAPSPSNNVPITLSFTGTNVPVNAALGTHFRLLATNSFLLQNPAGASDAQRIIFEIAQDTTGGRTMVLGNAFKLGQDLPALNLSTNANLRDFVTCVCSGTNFYVVGFVKGY